MIRITKVKFNKEQIGRFKKLGVLTVYIYGSQANGRAHSDSDIDVGVVFANPEKYKDTTIRVYSELFDIFSDVFLGRKIDVVLLQFTSPTLQFNAAVEGIVIYEANKEKSFQYKETAVKRYADIKYFLDLRTQEVLNRI